MNKAVSTLAALLFVAAASLGIAPSARAQSVTLDCTGSDLCYADVTPAGAYGYAWSFNSNGLNVIYPASCANQAYCSFYCPRTSGYITANVLVTDVNRQTVGSASMRALCTAQPL
ncbi:hypothetical protein [Xanthomonas sp. SI]|uniref:hypothetical protein n=1 Tax=Xanthomonas sp. SI TaxID=2724123 RepID=UPI001639F98D|nr:hypothetical protein [Xanthomonas sp. SI]QNH10818.1 hypothetical protein HEP75_00227 [Xanthomonas sp. SI]